MARHILQGARPAFSMARLMGSLDAPGSRRLLFWQQVWASALVQTLLYLGVLLTSGWVAQHLAPGRWASWGCCCWRSLRSMSPYIQPPPRGYGEALLLGNLILLTGMRIGRSPRPITDRGALALGAIGILHGLGLWAFA
jgi:hypothetical protein